MPTFDPDSASIACCDITFVLDTPFIAASSPICFHTWPNLLPLAASVILFTTLLADLTNAVSPIKAFILAVVLALSNASVKILLFSSVTFFTKLASSLSLIVVFNLSILSVAAWTILFVGFGVAVSTSTFGLLFLKKPAISIPSVIVDITPAVAIVWPTPAHPPFCSNTILYLSA